MEANLIVKHCPNDRPTAKKPWLQRVHYCRHCRLVLLGGALDASHPGGPCAQTSVGSSSLCSWTWLSPPPYECYSCTTTLLLVSIHLDPPSSHGPPRQYPHAT